MPTDACAPCANGCDPAQQVGSEQGFWFTVVRIMCPMLEELQAILAALEVIAPGSAQPSTSTVTAVPDSAVSVTLLAANPLRRGAIFYNDSTEILYLKLGAIASTVSYTVQLDTGGTYILTSPIYTGIVDGIWAADAAGQVLVTEILP